MISPSSSSPAELPAWKRLSDLAVQLKSQRINDLFQQDPNRFENFSLELPCFLLDYSKNLISADAQAALLDLARESGVETWRDKMFTGEHINATEDRAVMHIALRDRSSKPIMVDGQDVRPAVSAELERMRKLSERVRSGEWRGYTGKPITDVVSIGIGGSNLGPLMVTEALKAYSDKRLQMHYVSNVDGVQIAEVLAEKYL